MALHDNTRHPPGRHEVDFHTADGVFIKSITGLKRDDVIPQHIHLYDHTTFIATGSIGVFKDNVWDNVYFAPAAVLIKAGVKHTFLAMVDGTSLLCIHNLKGEATVKVLAEHEIDAADIAALTGA